MFKTCLFLLIVAAICTMGTAKAPSQVCPENEFYTDCGADCQTECATLNEPCYIRHVKCPEGCYCNKGYARNGNGKCVRIEECFKNCS